MALYLNTPVQVSCWHFWDITSKQYRRAVCMPVLFTFTDVCFSFHAITWLNMFSQKILFMLSCQQRFTWLLSVFSVNGTSTCGHIKKKKKKKEPSSANLVEFMTALWPLHKDMTYHRKQVLLHFTVMAFY